MSTSRAALIGIGTFVVSFACSLALLAALDVHLVHLVAPAVVNAVASYAAYRIAVSIGAARLCVLSADGQAHRTAR